MAARTFAQVSDPHISRAGDKPHGVDVRANFCRILSEVAQAKVEHLLLTGDLCVSEGDVEIYRWIRAQLESLMLPFSVVPGNHDDAGLLADVFGLGGMFTDGVLHYRLDLFGKRFLFADTSSGSLSRVQLEWMETQCEDGPDDVLLVLHHPPTLAGVPFMDHNYPLENLQETQTRLMATGRSITVLCGHYHVEKTVRLENITVLVCPSTFFQIAEESSELVCDFSRIGWRRVEIDGRNIRSSVKTVRI